MKKQNKIVIIAGPNGAGKTTFAREFLPKEASCPVFVNADLIAAGISPFKPEIASFHAGRLMRKKIAAYPNEIAIYAKSDSCCCDGFRINCFFPNG